MAGCPISAILGAFVILLRFPGVKAAFERAKATGELLDTDTIARSVLEQEDRAYLPMINVCYPGIYRLASPEGKLKIGYSRNLKKRYKSYLKGDGNTVLDAALKQHGLDSFRADVLIMPFDPVPKAVQATKTIASGTVQHV